MLLTLLLFCLIGKSQYNFSALDKWLPAHQKILGNNGIMLIYKNDKIIYQKPFGDVTIKTKMPIADCSKWLTAALVMTFVEEGKLSLEDKVSDYLPLFATYNKKFITIRQCLSHQTGLTDKSKFNPKKYESLEVLVNAFAKKEIATNPGTEFYYGEIGSAIAGRIIEVISKKKFDNLMKQRIFTPLDMRFSSFNPEDGSVDPAQGAISTAGDYLNFLTMILNKGKFMGKQILSEKSIAQMETSETSIVPKKYLPKTAAGFDYGLGAWITEKDAAGNSSTVACAGLLGTLPFVDKCREYAAILFIKPLSGEQPKELYIDLKKNIDEQIPAVCK